MTFIIDEQRLRDFIRESNHIEGIERTTFEEVTVTRGFLKSSKISVEALIMAVGVFQPGAKLRDKKGMDVRVGNHTPIRGGPEIRMRLENLLTHMHKHSAYKTHLAYQMLHPFSDGNGRSGRLLWLWQMKGDAPLGFLHHFYYQSLARESER